MSVKNSYKEYRIERKILENIKRLDDVYNFNPQDMALLNITINSANSKEFSSSEEEIAYKSVLYTDLRDKLAEISDFTGRGASIYELYSRELMNAMLNRDNDGDYDVVDVRLYDVSCQFASDMADTGLDTIYVDAKNDYSTKLFEMFEDYNKERGFINYFNFLDEHGVNILASDRKDIIRGVDRAINKINRTIGFERTPEQEVIEPYSDNSSDYEVEL